MSLQPYYEDDTTQLYCGDMREVLPVLDIAPDLIVADPPYQETSLGWDRWPDGWPGLVAKVASSLWCFGSMRMFLDRCDEFADWRLSQDVVWRKPAGSGLAADRYRRVHEHVLHWYRGPWSAVHHDAQRVVYHGPNQGRRSKGGSKGAHLGVAGTRSYEDNGTRLVTSVIDAPQVRNGVSPTQKPVSLLASLIQYACPSGGTVLDPFAGSCSTGVAARLTGRRAVLIEADEAMCEKAVRLRLAQDVLPLEVSQ